MFVLVVEPNHRGHHYVYVRLLLQALAEVAERVTLAVTPEGARSVEYESHLAPHAHLFAVDDSWPRHAGGALGERAWRELGALDRIVRRHHCQHVLIPNAPYLVPLSGPVTALGALFAPRLAEVEVGFIRCRFAYPSSGLRRVKQAAIVESYRWSPWQRFHTIDALAFDWIQRRGGHLRQRFHLMPDPVEPIQPLSKLEARRRLRVPEAGRYVGMVGTMAPRHGVHLLLSAFAEAKLAPDDRLLLAGRVPETLHAWLERNYGSMLGRERIVLLDHYLPDEQFHWAISAMDVVATPYLYDFGSSGAVVRAAALGRPVLAHDDGWLRHIVPRLGLGWTVDAKDKNLLSAGIRHVLDTSDAFENTEARRRFVEYSRAEHFGTAWTERIRQRIEAPPKPRPGWDWVMEAAQQR